MVRRSTFSNRAQLSVTQLEAREVPAGGLDPTFGVSGKVLTDIGGVAFADGPAVIEYQSTGKAILVGSSGGDMVVVRYNTDGSLDTTFGTGGTVRIDFNTTYEFGYSVAVDSAGRVLAAGTSNQTATGSDFAVARLTASGALDPTFDGDGKQTIDFGNSSDHCYSVTVDSADRVLLAGESHQSGATDFAVARLTPSGALDTTFDGDGKQAIDFGVTHDQGRRVAVDSADRVLVAGRSLASTDAYTSVARLTPSGTLDPTFDGDGKQTIDFGSTPEYFYDLAVDSVDRVLVAGAFYQAATGEDFTVARLTVSGTLDPTFDGDGKQTIDFGSPSHVSESAKSVVVDSADRVLVAGSAWAGNSTGYDFAVARLTTTGALDTTFDGDGKQTIDFGISYDFCTSMTVDSAQRVLVPQPC